MTLNRQDENLGTVSRPLQSLSIAFTLTLFLFVTLGWIGWSSYNDIEKYQKQAYKILELKGLILQYDEVLTMSAKMASATGDMSWEKRYRSVEPQLDLAIKELVALEPDVFNGEAASKTEAANIKLVAMENEAFNFVRQGRADEATLLLTSKDYKNEKSIYSSGMQQVKEYLEDHAKVISEKHRRRVFLAVLAVTVGISLITFAWFITHRNIKTYISTRKRAEGALKESEEKFRALADTSPLAIYMSEGIDQKAVYINPTFIRLFGYTIDEVPTVDHWWLLAYPDPNYRQQVADEWQKKVAYVIETESEIEPMEVVVTCKDGSTKDISWGFINIGKQNWAYGLDLTERKLAEKGREKLIKKLQTVLKEMKTLKGIIPICMHCKGIRDDKGSWTKLEQFITEHSEAQFSHGICEKCLEKYYPEEDA